jgi:hypothetical protein
MEKGTKRERLLAMKDEYIALGHEPPIYLPDVVRWAIQEGKWPESQTDIEQRLARELGAAMCQETYIDPQGNSVRVNYAAPGHGKDGQLEWAWDTAQHATRDFMQASLQDRRMKMVRMGKKLKADVDSYNRNYNTGEPLQLSLNITNDVAEIEEFERLSRNLVDPSAPEQPSSPPRIVAPASS